MPLSTMCRQKKRIAYNPSLSPRGHMRSYGRSQPVAQRFLTNEVSESIRGYGTLISSVHIWLRQSEYVLFIGV